MATVKFVQAKATTLHVGISSAESNEIVLKQLVDIYGNQLALSDFGDIIYITIDPGGSAEEIVSATGFTVNSDSTVSIDTGIVRALAAKSPYSTGGTASEHAAGVRVVVSNNPQIYASFVSLTGAQTIEGVKTFSSSPIVPTPSGNTDAANKAYVDGVVSAGASDSNDTTKGLVERATAAQIEAGTADGSDDTTAPLVPNVSRLKASSYGLKVFERYGDYATDAVGTDAYAITLAPVPAAYVAGMLIQFKPGTTNTGACTINVNSLGVKDIKIGGQDPLTGDLDSSFVYILIYDGTNFEVLNPKARTPAGSIQIWGTSTAPTGFLLCDGSAVSRTTYAALFAVIGTTFGVGDGSTTFNLPNLKNRVPVGVDTSVKTVLEDCEDAWNELVDGDVTASLDTVDFQVGSGSAKFICAAGLGAGDIIATEAISSTDLFGQTHVSLWIKSSVATSAGDLQLLLDDTSSCASPLESIDIPALVAGVWTRVHLALANPGLDENIISVGLKYVVDIGAVTINIDDICFGENFEVGANGGAKTHDLLINEIPGHTHVVEGKSTGGAGGEGFQYLGAGATIEANDITSASAGGGQAHPNMQPYLTMNFIIKT